MLVWIQSESTSATKTSMISQVIETFYVEEASLIAHLKHVYILTVVAKIIRTLVFSPAKNGFKSVISIFCCSASVANISLHFQTFILPLNVIIQWDFCLHKESDNSQIWSHHQSVWNDMKKQNKLRQTKSRRTVATSPRCFKKPTCKAA